MQLYFLKSRKAVTIFFVGVIMSASMAVFRISSVRFITNFLHAISIPYVCGVDVQPMRSWTD